MCYFSLNFNIILLGEIKNLQIIKIGKLQFCKFMKFTNSQKLENYYFSDLRIIKVVTS